MQEHAGCYRVDKSDEAGTVEDLHDLRQGTLNSLLFLANCSCYSILRGLLSGYRHDERHVEKPSAYHSERLQLDRKDWNFEQSLPHDLR